MNNQAHIVVTLIPISVKHRLLRNRNGGYRLDPRVHAFWDAMKLACIRQSARQVYPGTNGYEVAIGLYLGKCQKLDADNGLSLILDGLVKCGIIPTSDAAVTRIVAEKFRDWENPRTSITVVAR